MDNEKHLKKDTEEQVTVGRAGTEKRLTTVRQLHTELYNFYFAKQ